MSFKLARNEKGEFEFPSLEGYQIYQYVIVPEFSVNGNVETVIVYLERHY